MAPPSIIDDPAQASRRARVRIGVAVALLVTAIGILAMLNQRKSPEAQTQPVSAPAVQTSISSQEAEHPAEVQPQQGSDVAPTPASTAAPPPPVPGTLPAAPPAKHPQPAESAEKTGGKTISAHAEQPSVTKTTEPLTPTKQAATEPARSSEPAKAGAPKEFEVQLGVFGDMENAKQLQAKLAEHGIPSHSETRVQVGPFKTRAEADQAREKLKAMGISAVIAPR